MAAHNYEELREHIGHDLACVGYGQLGAAPANVAIECMTCGAVLVDFDKDEIYYPPSVQVRRNTFASKGGKRCNVE